ncbi:MAG: Uma2 family endonuclease, partial [Chloroflexota bacterium]|nr:Uma2 family endonuclease [Chloroflexota bacterium]
MALPQVQVMTPEAFDVFAELPENAETLYEYIDGEIYEMPSNTHSSEVGITFAVALFNFVKPRKLGHVTGENGGYQIAGARIAPDVAFISSVRQKKLARRGYNPNPPELAVEVLSPTDRADQIAKKRAKYEEAGVYHIWIDPE